MLDVTSVPLREPRPRSCQIENWLIEPNHWWKPEGRLAWNYLNQFADQKGSLWLNGSASSYCQNNRIPIDQCDTINNSLKLINISNMSIRVLAPGEYFGDHRRRIQGYFRFGHLDYGLRITDPEFESEYLARPNGNYSIGECYLTVSIGEPFNGFRYKLIAAIIERARTP